MMIKKFNATGIEKVGTNSGENMAQDKFPKGTKYAFNDHIWFVIKAWVDSSTETRLIESQTGEQQIVSLVTLQRDAASNGFMFLEPTEFEKLKIKARAE